MIITVLLKLIKLLPLNVIYLISDFTSFIIKNIFNYRQSIVKNNLRRSNLKLDDYQIQLITNKFYKYFTDLYLESIKMDSFSKLDFDKRLEVINVDLLNKFYDEGKSVVLMLSHYAGYEWCTSLPYYIKHKLIAVYTPIKNKSVNSFIHNSRSKHGLDLISRYDAIKEIYKREVESEKPYMYGLVADQSPQLKSKNYWSKFLGVNVPIFTGSERIAKKYNLPVIYGKMKKIKRGYYSVEFELIAESPNDYSDYEITEKYLKQVENQLKEDPHPYLWTHNRFKHSDEAPKT